MPPKKRDPENDTVKKPKSKKQKKKVDEFSDSESDPEMAEIGQNNGNGASIDEPEISYDIVRIGLYITFSRTP